VNAKEITICGIGYTLIGFQSFKKGAILSKTSEKLPFIVAAAADRPISPAN